MTSALASFFGFLASIVGLCIQLPQIYKIIKTKSATDLSYGTIIILTTNQFLWFSYAYLTGTTVLMIYATGAFIIDGTELLLKIYFDRRKKILELSDNT